MPRLLSPYAQARKVYRLGARIARASDMKATALSSIRSGTAGFTIGPRSSAIQRWTAALFVLAIFGCLAGLGGFCLWLLSMIGLIAATTNLYTVGTLLIGASFVLFGLSAHCLDRVDAADKSIRVEYCRQHGLGDGELE